MSDFITTAFVQDYKTTVQMLAQQMGSRLRPLVSMDMYQGKAGKAVEQFGQTKAVKRTSRHSDTPLIGTPQEARWVYPVDYEWADLIDDQDKLRMAIDPTSPIAQAGAFAMGRAMDDEILGAFYGDARTGEDGTDTTVFDTNNVVGVNTGGTTSGLNVAKLREAKRIIMSKNVDLEREQLKCVITSREHDALLNEIQVVSTDFNDRPVLVDGYVKRFLGIDFIHMEFTDTTAFDNASSMIDGSSYRRVPLFTERAMHLGLWSDTEAKMSERDDKGYATQVYLKNTVGATRTDEDRIVEIKCA